jgi:hypothetical protein
MREIPGASLARASHDRPSADDTSTDSRAASRTGRVWRVATVAVLLTVTVIGLRSRGASRPCRTSPAAVAAYLVAPFRREKGHARRS